MDNINIFKQYLWFKIVRQMFLEEINLILCKELGLYIE